MEASTEAYLWHLRSLPYNDYFWDGDVPDGYERCAGADCWRCEFADDNPDSVHCIRYA
jgi:hypothetical protein